MATPDPANGDRWSVFVRSPPHHRLWFGFWGKTPTIFPVASIKRKVSGSCPGWRRATSCARSLAAAALGKTEVSLSTKMPFLSQSTANNSISSPATKIEADRFSQTEVKGWSRCTEEK
jgi:hypothetical protein